jgi:opacity protein-like surface antigen
MKQLFGVVIALCVMASVVSANLNEDYTLKVNARAWFQKMDADLKDTSSGGRSDTVDFAKTLGLDDSNTEPNIDITWRFAEKHRLRFGYWSYGSSATKTVSQSVTFDNKTYAASASLSSKLDLDTYDIAYEYDFIRDKQFMLSLIVDIKVFSLDVALSGVATDLSTNISQTQSYSESATAGLPLLGLGAKFAPVKELPLALSLDAAGMTIGSKGNYIDAEFAIEYDFTKNIGLEAGYKYENLKVDASDLEAKLGFNGPFAGIVVKF